MKPSTNRDFNLDNQRENWLGRLEKLIANDDRTSRDGSSGCSSLTDTCDPGPGLQCHEFYAKGADEGSEIGEMYYDAAWKQAYWVFKAVKGAHKKIIAMKQNLDDGVDIAGLNVKAILNDFGVSPDDLKDGSDVTGGLAAALSIGAAFAGLGGTKGAALGAGLSVGSTILGQLKQDDTFSTADIESSLAEAFKTWKDDLSDVLRIALGGGKDNAEFESLPDLSDEKHRDHESHIGRFFATPFWLLDTDADEIQSLGKNAEAGIQLKLIDLAL